MKRANFLLTFVLIFTVLSCKMGDNNVWELDISSMPSLTIKYDTTVYFDSGRVVLRMTFPIMEKYDNAGHPYYEFRKGLYVDFFDRNRNPSGSISSKYAIYREYINLWELRDSVVVINQDGEKLETDNLFWDEAQDLIYTDRFVKLTSADQIMMGTGFQSDSQLRKRRIWRVSATIYLDE